jgi:hypothetical protein
MLERSGREMSCGVVVDQFQEVFAVTIAASGREHRDVRDADVFSWNELPELLAAVDLFDPCGTACEPVTSGEREGDMTLDGRWTLRDDRLVAAGDEDDKDDDEDDDYDDDEDEEDDDYEDEEEEDDEDEDEEEDEEWEEVDDEDEEEDDEEEEDEEEEEEEEEDEDWEDDDEDWEDEDEDEEEDDDDD